jgi:hypothetical protein
MVHHTTSRAAAASCLLNDLFACVTGASAHASRQNPSRRKEEMALLTLLRERSFGLFTFSAAIAPQTARSMLNAFIYVLAFIFELVVIGAALRRAYRAVRMP